MIDSDLGLSGADRDRERFHRLLAEVGIGRTGIVLGLEVVRLARNSAEWHRLLDIYALSETLILDEDGVYDPLGNVVLDPDEQVQHSLRLIFDTCARTGSASATVRRFNNEKLMFPYRPQGGPHSGELHWKPLRFSRRRWM